MTISTRALVYDAYSILNKLSKPYTVLPEALLGLNRLQRGSNIFLSADQISTLIIKVNFE